MLWAQRSSATDAEKNILYVTIAAEDVSSPKLDLTPTSLHFTGTTSPADDDPNATPITYDLHIEFYDEIDPQESKYTHTDRHTVAVLRKAKKQEEYWPRLTKDKKKYFYIRTDFDKWVDEDEQDDASVDDMGLPGLDGDFDMGGMGGMGGMNMDSLKAMAGGADGMDGFGDQSELLESIKQDAAAQGKNLEDLGKTPTVKPPSEVDQLSFKTGRLGDEDEEEEEAKKD